MKVGDQVWNAWQGLLRFGVIREKTSVADGWAYFKVDWHNDDAYEQRVGFRKQLTGRDDHGLFLYRADQLHPLH